MSISDIGSLGQSRPAFMPLNRSGGSGFGDALQQQIRGQVARSLAGGEQQPAAPVSSTRPPAPPAATGDSGVYHSTNAVRLAGIADGDSTGWSTLTRRIGGQYLPPSVADVFTKQIALESGNFSPDVIYGRIVSSAGAQGIAQLMPSSYPNVNRLDPIASLNAAASTMRDNLALFGGDLRKALAAYNAGAGLVQNLSAQYGAGWERGLPAETQQYLKLLLG